MRWLQAAGVVIAAAGFFAAFAWPLISERQSGGEKARLLVFNRDDGGWERGWRPVQVDLSPAENPVRIVLDAKFLPAAVRRGATTGLVMLIARDGAIIREMAFAMPVPGKGKGKGEPRGVTLPTPEFTVATAGKYTITVRSTETEDAGFLGADAVVRVGAASDPNRWQMPGYAGIALGTVLYLLGGGRVMTASRRRRRKRRR